MRLFHYFLGLTSALLLATANLPAQDGNTLRERLEKKYDDAVQYGPYYVVRSGESYGLVDSLSNEVLPVKYVEIGVALDHLFTVRDDAGWWLVTYGGQVLSKRAFKDILLGKFNKEKRYFIAVDDGDYWGLLDADGTAITPMALDFVTIPRPMFMFSDVYPLFMLDGENYRMVSPFQEGLAVVEKQVWMDSDEEDGPPVIEVYYRGYMDTNCRIVIDCIYDEASPFKNGCAQVKKDGKTLLIIREDKVADEVSSMKHQSIP